MSRKNWIGIVLAVVLVAGGWWYLNQSNAQYTKNQIPSSSTSSPKVVKRGDNIAVSWTAPNPTADVYAMMTLVGPDDSSVEVGEGLPATHSTYFSVPTTASENMGYNGYHLIIGRTYHIRITIYRQLCKENCDSSPTKQILSTRDDYYFTLDPNQQ